MGPTKGLIDGLVVLQRWKQQSILQQTKALLPPTGYNRDRRTTAQRDQEQADKQGRKNLSC